MTSRLDHEEAMKTDKDSYILDSIDRNEDAPSFEEISKMLAKILGDKTQANQPAE